MEKYDGIIIGFGKGGKTLAADLANQGYKIAMIEKSEKMYGGTCINVGCIPSKSLVKNALMASRRIFKDFSEREDFYRSAVEEKDKLTSMLRKKNFDKLDTHENITVYHGKASFLDDHHILVEMGEGNLELEGDLIFINTGSVPVLSGMKGAENVDRVYTSESLMDEPRLPKRLAIIGGGYIGLEFASIYRNFGSEVTVFEYGAHLLPKEDEDMAEEIQRVMEEKGIRFHFSSEVQELVHRDHETELSYVDHHRGIQEKSLFDGVLFATGRKPNTEGLYPDRAGVELTEKGAVKIDDRRRTTKDHIYAMGDVAGGLQFTYISLDDYRIVSSDLRKDENPYSVEDRHHVPYSVFIDPPYSRVGLSEKEALALGYRVKTGKLPAGAIPKAHILQETKGMLKVVVDEDSHRILGAMLYCTESHEMINVIKLAMDLDINYEVLRDQIYTHPTMTEAFNDLFIL